MRRAMSLLFSLRRLRSLHHRDRDIPEIDVLDLYVALCVALADQVSIDVVVVHRGVTNGRRLHDSLAQRVQLIRRATAAEGRLNHAMASVVSEACLARRAQVA